ncbi:dihydrolipoyl dehydrogenase [Kangiella koreensis]|uniref:Dihydrolipoyl dehydrogenase n=1 Tax=Kangiella koreensis (strain DSM 16069 / JCM 12317 / KCTC 12182 / SW-125) TaxID=523791 RepID=C7RA15_KANKD|nr:dihydrolipoyl dehydrogenase [Kangiella koreensis]ACV26134.1 dihydrolipoamide dehydrogenase [Kangiella koreensis DSM 16069]
MSNLHAQVVVLGSGPGGYNAAFRAADLGMDVILIEKYSVLGGVCLNVGCIPSKALLHTAKVIDEAEEVSAHGVNFGKPKFDIDKIREYKDGVVKQLTGGLAGMAKGRKVKVVEGYGKFTGANEIEVENDGKKQKVTFDNAIIAAGSRVVQLPFLPEDDRIVDSTGALELRQVPKHMLVIGGGIIGLEMATVYRALGAKITVVEMADQLVPAADKDVVKVLEKYVSAKYENILLETSVTKVEAKKDGLYVTFEGKNAPEKPQKFDMILSAVGRRPNGDLIDADKAGVKVSDRGFIEVDKQMRTNVPHIYAIGDIVGQPMLAHKASAESHVAAEVIAGKKHYFDPLTIPSVAYTDPELAWVGLTEKEAKEQGIDYGVGKFPWAASGRAIGVNRKEGFTKLLFDKKNNRVIGGAIVGVNAGELIAEVGLAIEMGCDAEDIGLTIHAHPTLSESVSFAAEVYEGVCTDLPAQRKKK